MKDSVHKKRVTPSQLQPGAPDVLIIIMDDVGPATPSAYGGEINTPQSPRAPASSRSRLEYDNHESQFVRH